MKTDFRPPLDNRLLIGLTHLALPLILRLRHVMRVQLPDADWEHLEALRDGRLILSANHPTGTDPLVAMYLARRLGRYMNFVAARENFDGAYGWLLQRLGAYSIARGLPDRDSLRTSRQLLAEKDRKVALFPEGETYFHNDLTLPFHSGVTQLGFWTIADLVKLGKDPRLPIVPVAIKYRFLESPKRDLRSRLSRLEVAVGATPRPDGDWYLRLVSVGEKVLEGVERQYGIPVEPDRGLDSRIERVKDEILNHVSRHLGHAPPEGPLPERMRALFNAVEEYASAFASGTTAYEHRLNAQRHEEARPLLADLWRLHDCMAMTGHYVRDFPSCERFSEVVGRLEEEVFGRAYAETPCEALVRIAPPLELAERQEEYREDRRAAVARATRALEERVVGLLRELSRQGQPLRDG